MQKKENIGTIAIADTGLLVLNPPQTVKIDLRFWMQVKIKARRLMYEAEIKCMNSASMGHDLTSEIYLNMFIKYNRITTYAEIKVLNITYGIGDHGHA